ncbi:MAG: DHH family phosphoesterase [Clostridia bacterium]|nr:DHH family phosphoesterase [Clostridia bacterium]
MKNKKAIRDSRRLATATWVCIVSGALLFTAYTVICTIGGFPEDLVGVICLAVYLACATAVFLANRDYRKKKKLRAGESAALSTVMTEVIQAVNIPFVLTDTDERVIWYNNAFFDISGRRRSLLGAELTEFCQISPEKLSKSNPNFSLTNPDVLPTDDPAGTAPATIGDRRYLARSFEMRVAGKTYFLSVFTDSTELLALTERIEAETPVIAYITLDNLDELAQYVRVSSREAATEAQNVIKAWANQLDALMCEYERDKFLLTFEMQKLKECVENRFDILEQIRNIKLGDSSMPITVSMGISAVGNNMNERGRNARTALDMALQRGGDQVALRTEKGLEFFGGRTKNMQKRTKVMARVIAGQLASLIANAGNVIIMGHSNPDFDSIGACVGIARLCMHCGVAPKIVMNRSNGNFVDCSERLLALEEYHNLFVDAATGIDLVRSDTLLVIVDANNFAILEEPAIAENVSNIAVIDHHRKTSESKFEPTLNYIDPSASSACELVAEILEHGLPVGSLLKEESTVMLAGIMVDTKNFTRSTGTRTFSAALYLRGEGANAEIATTFFNEDFSDFSAEAKFNSNVTIYRDTIAITTSLGSGSPSDRVAASRVADKLLTVKNVDASFALVLIDNVIHISARSNGTINVQLILEKLNGGGHFNIAGAQLSGKNMKDALVRLKDAIDEYLDNL